MIDLEFMDYVRAQVLMGRMENYSDFIVRFWEKYIAQFCDKDSNDSLEATATAIKGLREYKTLFVFIMKLLDNENFQHEWSRYCDTKEIAGELDVLLKGCPGIDLHMRLFEETKCFAFELDNPLFELPPFFADEEYILISLNDPGNEKLHEIYEKFGNGKQVPKGSIADIMQQILNGYKIPTEVVDECLLKLPLKDFSVTLAAVSVLDAPEEMEIMMHQLY